MTSNGARKHDFLVDEKSGREPASGKDKKWWHVEDSQIENLVQQMGTGGASASSLLSSRTRRGPARADVGKPPSNAAVGSRVGGMSQQGEEERAVVPGDAPTLRPSSRERRVRFDHEEDAIDKMLKRTRNGESWDETTPEEVGGKKSWKVSDEEFQNCLMKMAANDDSHRSSSSMNLGERGTKATADRAASQTKGRGRCGAVPRGGGDEKITVNVFFQESGDTLTVRVNPDLRLGPPKPPPTDCFTKMFGLGASTKGFDQVKKNFDYQQRSFGDTQRPGWRPDYTESLKGLIENLTEIEPSKQRLSFKQFPMGEDESTLRLYGLRDGDTIAISIRTWEPGMKKAEPTLAVSTKRKPGSGWEERMRRRLAGEPEPNVGSNYSLRQSKHLKDCKSNGDVWMMPRWISQSSPNLFAPIGVGVSGDGSNKVRKDFATSPIYISDGADSRLSRVREMVTGHKAYTSDYTPTC